MNTATAWRILPTFALLLLAACSGHSPLDSASQPGLALQGRMHGGQQPVTGATIQLYGVGTSGDGSAATALLSPAVISDGSGNFILTNLYHCSPANEEVYLVGTGGNPGLGTGTNKNIAMMAALGPCNLLTSSTFIDMDEVTTLGSLATLYPYMTGYANLGSGAADATAFSTAFTQVSEFVNTATGLAPGTTVPTGYYASTTELNTLADILAPCINSAGGVAGDGSACGNLFQLATPSGGTAPTDTVGAAIDILKNPTQNAAALFNTLTANPPFQPVLSAAPTTWALTLKPLAAAPTFSTVVLNNDYYDKFIQLSDTTPNSSIYYTRDGSTPTTASTLYTGPISLIGSTTVATVNYTINAIAVAPAYGPSNVATANYSVSYPQNQPPTFSPTPGTYTGPLTVTVSPAVGTSGLVNCTGPTVTGNFAGYSRTYTITQTTDFSCIVQGGSSYARDSNPATATYTINLPALPAPTFSLAGGTYTGTQSVFIYETAPVSNTLYYTTDGSTPTAQSLQVPPAAIPVTSSMTLKAIAIPYVNPTIPGSTSGYSQSAVATASYVIK